MDNVELIKTAYAAFGRGDIPAILDLLDDSIEWLSPLTLPQGGTFSGKDGVLKFFQAVGGAWDPLQVEAKTIGAISADTVVSVVHGTGSLRSGGPAEYGAAHVFTLRGGKVVRFQEFVDLDKPLTA